MIIFMRIKKVNFGFTHQRDKMIAAICETGGQFTYVYAMSGNGAAAAPIISSVCVVALLLSRIFLKEKLSIIQYIFVAIIMSGIIVLSLV